MRIAIAGSRDYPRPDLVLRFIANCPPGTTIASGGAQGPDTTAIRAAKARNLPTELHPANWDQLGKKAGILRNEAFIPTCDALCAFWDLHSRGTAHAIATARTHHLKIRIYGPDGEPVNPNLVSRSGRLLASVTVLTDHQPLWEPETINAKHGRGISRRISLARKLPRGPRVR